MQQASMSVLDAGALPVPSEGRRAPVAPAAEEAEAPREGRRGAALGARLESCCAISSPVPGLYTTDTYRCSPADCTVRVGNR